jgi:epoxyqueuosine reductase
MQHIQGCNKVHPEKSSRLTREVKEKALSAGADLVGIVSTEDVDSIPRHWVRWQVQEHTVKTSHYMKEAKSVIVLGYHAWDDIHEALMPRNGEIEYPAYIRMRLFARRVVRFLKKRGYNAVIYPDLLPQKQMAQLAGLGALGKNALIINPKYGPWIRLQSVLTDANLVPDEPFEEDLCGDCEECVHSCPVDALTPYAIDSDRCLIGITEAEWVEVLNGDLDYASLRTEPRALSILDKHMPKFTENSRLMCITCQKACPYGMEERGHTPP